MTIYHLFEADELALNLVFRKEEINDFLEMWNAGISVSNIAKKMKRNTSEIVLLVFDHAERNILPPRDEGIYGI